MMKRIWIIVLAILSLALIFSAHAETSTTLLVYMCGADLQSAACEDIYEMGIAEVGDNVNIVILAGGAEEWDFDEIQGNTRNLITLRDGNFESIIDWGWKSMGSEESLLEFLRYGLTEYPADRTVAVLWDHGAGSEAGVCFDDTTEDQDGLSLLEINNVLYDLHEQMGDYHIDIFGCDACMMATYEMAAMLSYYDIDYYIASEELEPGIGWHYTSWLEKLGKQPDMTAEELCGCIVDNYMEAGLKETPDDYLTLSVISLHEMGNLQEAVEKLASTMLGELQQGNAADLLPRRVRKHRLALRQHRGVDGGSRGVPRLVHPDRPALFRQGNHRVESRLRFPVPGEQQREAPLPPEARQPAVPVRNAPEGHAAHGDALRLQAQQHIEIVPVVRR